MTISAQAAADVKKLDEEFHNGSVSKKAAIKTIMGLSVIMASNLDRSIKNDAILATVEMYSDLIRFDTLNTILDFERDTKAPLGMIVGAMGMKASESAEKHERRFNTMMQLFIEEMGKRDG